MVKTLRPHSAAYPFTPTTPPGSVMPGGVIDASYGLKGPRAGAVSPPAPVAERGLLRSFFG